MQQQQTTVIGEQNVNNQPIRRPYPVDGYKARQSFGVGVSLIVVGVISIACHIADLGLGSDFDRNGVTYYDTDSYSHYRSYSYFTMCTSTGCIGHGLWAGVMFIITGAIAIVASRTKGRCAITALLILSIFATIIAGVVFIISAIGASVVGTIARVNGCNDNYSNVGWCSKVRGLIAMEAMIAAMCCIAFALNIWASVLCCVNTGCCAPQMFPTYAYVTTGAQMAVVTTTQQGYNGPQYYAQPQTVGQPQYPYYTQQGACYVYPAPGSNPGQQYPGAVYPVAPPSYTPGNPPTGMSTSPPPVAAAVADAPPMPYNSTETKY